MDESSFRQLTSGDLKWRSSLCVHTQPSRVHRVKTGLLALNLIVFQYQLGPG